jgi:protein-S-isoprenylcysteine O-methyltransferase Ste14
MKTFPIPPVIVLVSLLTMLLIYFVLPGFTIIPYPYDLTGIIIAFWGFIIMGKSWELFQKYQLDLGYNKPEKIITEGIYSRTRNPMYVGMFMLLLGFGVSFGNLFTTLEPLVFLLILNFYHIPKEEALMKETFGETYLRYCHSVKRWI